MNKKPSIPIINFSVPSGRLALQNILSLRRKRDDAVASRAAAIVNDVRKNGDAALFAYTKKFDGVALTAKTVRISQKEIEEKARKVPPALRKAMTEAARRIAAYHVRQRPAGFAMKTGEAKLGQIVRPLQRIAVYVPGGRAVYPSSVLMNVIPARIAGVPEIAAVTPPGSGLDPAVAFALKLCRVREVYRVGGAQAVAALAFGTKSIRPVDKIVGPGNAWVAAAKRLVYGAVDIDSIAGPSEVAVLADDTANPEWIALDLLAQAEHGSGGERAVVVTESRALAGAVAAATAREIGRSPCRQKLEMLPPDAITVFVTRSRPGSIALVNALAPEHLQIMTRKPRIDLAGVKNAAAVFLGPYTPVALGDYFIGTNHVLPTGGAARFASPLGVESFLKRMSVAEVSRNGLKKSKPYVSAFARAEGFIHHAMSVENRIKDDG